MQKVNLAEKLSQIREYWRPKVVGELNGQEVIVPRGVEHRAAADDEVHVLVFELWQLATPATSSMRR